MRLLAFWQTHASELGHLVAQHVGAGCALDGRRAGARGTARDRRREAPASGRAHSGLANLVQTIPSLALFGFLLPLPFVGGIGPRAAIVALVLYAVLPIMRTTVAGFQGIDPAVREAALAMGMRPFELLRLIELPLAWPSMLAGIRVATVVGVGTATIAAAIGAGGLGEYIFRGLSMVDADRHPRRGRAVGRARAACGRCACPAAAADARTPPARCCPPSSWRARSCW